MTECNGTAFWCFTFKPEAADLSTYSISPVPFRWLQGLNGPKEKLAIEHKQLGETNVVGMTLTDRGRLIHFLALLFVGGGAVFNDIVPEPDVLLNSINFGT